MNVPLSIEGKNDDKNNNCNITIKKGYNGYDLCQSPSAG